MSGAFLATSSQYLAASGAPVATFPLTMTAWVYPTTVAAGGASIVSLGSSSSSNSFTMRRNGAAWEIVSRAVGTLSGTASGTAAVNTWYFAAVRFISAINRRLAILSGDGTIQHLSQTSSSSPASIDTLAIGAERTTTFGSSWTGLIQDVCLWNADIQADGLQLNSNLLYQLAYQGPFSLPHLSKNLLAYRGMRNCLENDLANETIYVGSAPVSWTNAGGVGFGTHCPYLGPGYAGPIDLRTPGII